jgi:hypothetical protein
MCVTLSFLITMMVGMMLLILRMIIVQLKETVTQYSPPAEILDTKINFSPLPRRNHPPFSHVDNPNARRGHGLKIREYSSTMRESDGNNAEDDVIDDDEDSEFLPS